MKEKYNKYLEFIKKNKGYRFIKINTFKYYFTKHGGYNGVLKFLKGPYRTKQPRQGIYKIPNIEEVRKDYLLLKNVNKVAEKYGVSSRTIYRYINNYDK